MCARNWVHVGVGGAQRRVYAVEGVGEEGLAGALGTHLHDGEEEENRDVGGFSGTQEDGRQN